MGASHAHLKSNDGIALEDCRLDGGTRQKPESSSELARVLVIVTRASSCDRELVMANSALDARDHALTQAAKRVESAGRVNDSPETRPNSV